MKDLNKISEVTKELKKAFDELSNVLKKQREFYKQNKEFQQTLSNFGESLVRVHTETPDNLLNLSKYGWFLDFDCEMKYSFELNELIENDKYKLAEKSLINYYSSKLKEIFFKLSKRHPTRKNIFIQIEKSFSEELYYLTIPTILSQIDGICNDLTSKKFFIKNEDFLPEVYPKLEEINKVITDIFLAPIKNSSPINVWEKEIEKFPLKLNRNEIMHGVDTKYGNRTSSLKCLSLLNLISDLIIRID